jgi:hypothetical protein
LPFNSLNDRAFEILIYQIFKDKIERDENNIRNKFNSVYLMQGVGEKGRDCSAAQNYFSRKICADRKKHCKSFVSYREDT